MYTNYFGLKERPFAIALNPKFLFMSELHKEALAHLLYGINSEGCITLLTGDVGTGKTTLYRNLIDQLPPQTNIAVVLNPKMTMADILKTICDEFSINIEETSPTIKTYFDSINKYLLESYSRGENTAIIIDEAQNLDKEVLEHLRLLTNLETNTDKLAKIVLVGQPELNEMLQAPDLSQVNQRVTARYHLSPLLKKDIAPYIQHRLAVAGASRAGSLLLSKKALRLVEKKSKGIPRLINLLCDRALLGAYVENKDHVDGRVMRKAAQEVLNLHTKKSVTYKKIITVTALTALLLSVPIMYGLYHLGYYPSQLQNSKLLTIFNKDQKVVIEPKPLTLPNGSDEVDK